MIRSGLIGRFFFILSPHQAKGTVSAMDKRSKQQRHKTLSPEELAELGPGRASFDTEAGRAAQGMRKDLGKSAPDDDDQSPAAPPPPVHTGNPPTEEDVT